VTEQVRETETESSLEGWIAGMAFMLGLLYAPPGWMWGLLGLIVPSIVTIIAGRVLARMTWTPWRVFRAKRWIGGVFVAVCVSQVVENAHQTSHMECTQEVGGRDPECVEWTRVPGGDSEGALLWVALGALCCGGSPSPYATGHLG
jgi:hypothetical protein